MDASGKSRHRFLAQVHAVLSEQGAASRVRALASPQTSLRWQLYGHLLAERWDKAWELTEALPDQDGYALVATYSIQYWRKRCRRPDLSYPSSANGRAKVWKSTPPSSYIAVLAAEFDVAEGSYRRYDFHGLMESVLAPVGIAVSPKALELKLFDYKIKSWCLAVTPLHRSQV